VKKIVMNGEKLGMETLVTKKVSIVLRPDYGKRKDTAEGS
jgi:hypothetical protein